MKKIGFITGLIWLLIAVICEASDPIDQIIKAEKKKRDPISLIIKDLQGGKIPPDVPAPEGFHYEWQWCEKCQTWHQIKVANSTKNCYNGY